MSARLPEWSPRDNDGEKGSVKTIDTIGPLVSLLMVPRKLRVQYPGAIYHIMNRGDRREAIFADTRTAPDFFTRAALSNRAAREKRFQAVAPLPALVFRFHNQQRILPVAGSGKRFLGAIRVTAHRTGSAGSWINPKHLPVATCFHFGHVDGKGSPCCLDTPSSTGHLYGVQPGSAPVRWYYRRW
jgi:hypothetical protein